jgi:hypothetical protein
MGRAKIIDRLVFPPAWDWEHALSNWGRGKEDSRKTARPVRVTPIINCNELIESAKKRQAQLPVAKFQNG